MGPINFFALFIRKFRGLNRRLNFRTVKVAQRFLLNGIAKSSNFQPLENFSGAL